MADAITSRSEDYSQWYIDVVRNAKLADYSPVRGCMIIRPNGYALWENMRDALDGCSRTPATRTRTSRSSSRSPSSRRRLLTSRASPRSVPSSRTRDLRTTADGKGVEVDPDSRLEENLIVRPTSETIIWDAYSKWIQSWRDLPILLNQWANVVRWEMRTASSLRTMEFLWQEGHTAHAPSRRR
jgi:prolyl-tRNA synthetase